MKEFIAPKKNFFLPLLVKSLLNQLLKTLYNVTKIEISSEDIKVLKDFQDQRLIMLANHPSTVEPPLFFYISRIMQRPFEFMASRQVFEWGGGAVGWFIRRMGAYSIIAGINDKKSLQYTMNVLSRPSGKLVIFPEGEPTSGENSTFMPLQKGFSVLSIMSLSNLKRKEPQSEIHVLPTCFFYTYKASKEKMIKNIEKRLQKLEKALSIKNKNIMNPKEILERLINIGISVLEKYEKKYNIVPQENHDFKYRFGRLRHEMLNRLSKIYKVKDYNQEDNAIMKFRKIFSIAELCIIGYQDDSLPKFNKKDQKKYFTELIDTFEIIVINEEHLLSKPTFEKCFEWLTRYEALILGTKPRALGGVPSQLPRKAHIRLGKPFPLSNYISQDKKKRSELTEKLIKDTEKNFKDLLNQCEGLAHPIS